MAYNLPPYLASQFNNMTPGPGGPLGSTGTSSYTSSSRYGPQSGSTLMDLFNQMNPTVSPSLPESQIRGYYSNAINAAMGLGKGQVMNQSGELGHGPSWSSSQPRGVEQDELERLGLRVQEPLVKDLLANAMTGNQYMQSRLMAMLQAAMGPVSTSSSQSTSQNTGYRPPTAFEQSSQLPPGIAGVMNPAEGKNAKETAGNKPGQAAAPTDWWSRNPFNPYPGSGGNAGGAGNINEAFNNTGTTPQGGVDWSGFTSSGPTTQSVASPSNFGLGGANIWGGGEAMSGPGGPQMPTSGNNAPGQSYITGMGAGGRNKWQLSAADIARGASAA